MGPGIRYYLFNYSFLALRLGFCQRKVTTRNRSLTKLELENGIWDKIGLGNGVYTPLQYPPYRWTNWYCT